MAEERVRVLLLDDEESLRVPLKDYLGKHFGYRVDAVASGEEALEQVEKAQGRYDVALIDEVLLNPPDGIEVMEQIKARYPDIECIVFTGWDTQSRQRALRAGAFRYMEKPFDSDELAMLIRNAAQQVRLREIGRAILSERDLDRVLEGIASAACSLALADEAAIALLDQATGRIMVHAKTHPAELQWQSHFRGQALSREIIQTGRVMYVLDTTQDPRVDRKMIDAGIRSFLGLPIPGEGGNLGVLYVYSRQPGRFDEGSTVAVLQTLAGQAGLAIANARAFHQLHETKEQLDALIENSFDAIIAIDQDRKVTVFNQRAEEMFGWTREEMLGQSVARLHMDIGKAKEIFEAVNRHGTVANWDVDLKHRDGTRIPALLSATVIRDGQGKPIGQAGFMRDLRQMNLLEERLQALIEVSQAITGTLKLDEVLNIIAESALTAFPVAKSSTIHLYDRRDDLLHVRACTRDYSPEAIEALNLKVGEGIAGWVFQHQQSLVVPDTRQAPQYKLIDHPEIQAHRSMICVPLRVKGQAIGALSLNVDIIDAFQSEDLGLLSSFADQAAIAIDNARRMQELEHLRRAVEKLASAAGVQEVLQQVVDSARVVMEADSAVIWSYDSTRNVFFPDELKASGIDSALLEKFRSDEPKPGGTAETVMQRGYIAVIDINQPQYDFLGTGRGLREEIAVKAFQGISLQVGEDKLGVLYVNYIRPRQFSTEDKAMLGTFAHHAALALKRARLLEQVQKAKRTAEVVARVTTLEDVERTLQSVVRGIQDVTGCDAVTLYRYNQTTGKLDHPPTMVGVRYPERATRLGMVASDSVIYRMLNMDKPYVAEKAYEDDQFKNTRFNAEEEIKSLVAIPLQVRNQKVGVTFVNFRSPHRFTSDEITTIQLFADQAAVAIHNAQQYAEIVRDASLRQGLLQAGQEIMALQEPRDVLQNVVNIMRKVLACDVVTLYTYDQDRGEIGFPAYVAGELRDRKSLDELGYVSKDSVVGRLLASGEPHFADDAPNDPVMSAGGFVAREGVQSSAGIPLKSGNQVIGIVFVNYRAFHPFLSEEQEALLLFATQTAVAIHNARQFEQIGRKTFSLEALYEAGKALSGTLALDDILNHIVEQARNLTGRYGKQARFSHLALKEGRWLKFKAACPPECLPGLQKGVGDIDLEGEGRIGVTGRAVKTGESRLVGDVTQDPDYIAYDPETRSELAVPIKLAEEVIGVINVEHSDTHAFDQEDRRDLESLAAQAALAIRNARQYDELRRAKGIIGARTALAWMGMASSAWRHAIDKHATTVREQIQLLRKDLGRAPSHDHHTKVDERLSMIERLANQILEKPIVPPLSREEGVEPVALNDLVGERARQLWQNDPYKKAKLQLDLQLPGSATVRASPDWLRRAFDILVDNAVEAVADCEVRELTIGTRAADGGAEIRVSDTGPGIPEEIQAKIGLEAIEKPEDAKGLGMGLLMAQTIVQTYGGELRVASTGPTGTTMVIWLPITVQGRTEDAAYAD